MTDNQKRILEMLSEKKISVDEAHRLLNLIESKESTGERTVKAESGSKDSPKYLRVVVQPMEGNGKDSDHGRVNVRIPMSVIRAGMKLTSLIPPEATAKMNTALHEKGIDFDLRNLKPEDIEQLTEALGELEVDIESKQEKVKIYVE